MTNHRAEARPKNSFNKRPYLSRPGWLVVGFVVMGGLVTAFFLSWYVDSLLEKRAFETFERNSETRLNALQSEIQENVIVLKMLADLARVAREMRPGTLEKVFSRLGVENLSTGAVMWVQKVTPVQKSAWVKRFRQEHGGKLRVRLRALDKAPHGYQDHIIVSQETRIPNKKVIPIPLGMDLTAIPELAEALVTACDTGEMLAVAPTGLPGFKIPARQLLLLVPVYRGDAEVYSRMDRRSNLRGFFVGVVDVKELFLTALREHLSAGVDCVITDVSSTYGERFSYVHLSRARDDNEGQKPLILGGEKQFQWESHFALGGRLWRFQAVSAPGYGWGDFSWQALLVFSFVAWSAVLLGFVIFNLMVRQSRINREVKERTRELTAAKEEAENLYRIIPVPFFLVDKHRRITSVNRLLEELTGFEANDLVGKPCNLLLDDHGSNNCSLFLCEKHGPALNKDCTILTKDGRRLSGLKNADVLRNSRGEVVGGVELIQDVSEQRRMLAELAAGEERMRRIIEASAEGFWMLEPETGLISYVNQALCNMLGYPKDQLEGRGLENFLAPEVLEDYRRCFGDKINEGNQVYDSVLLSAGGERVYVVISSTCLTGGNGEVVSAFAFVNNITKLKQASERAEKQFARLSAIIAGMEEGLAFSDIRGRVVEVNRHFCRMTDIAPSRLLGAPLSALPLGLPADDIEDTLKAFRETGEADPFISQHALGSMEVITRLQPIMREGAFDGVVLTMVDVTELVTAKHRAEEANRAKTEFLSSMSHEIGTPMNGILGMADVLLESELNQDQMEQLEMLRSSAHTLMSLINNLLDYSKMESGDMELEPVPFNIYETLDSALQAMEKKAAEKGLELMGRIASSGQALLVGDGAKLYQVVFLLLENAIKFTDHGEIELSLKVLPVDSDNVELKVEVRDTGIGVPGDKVDQIFKVFRQVDMSVSRRFGGIGLGLAICKRLVDMMGGEMYVQSRMGEGSLFIFTAPFKVYQAAASQNMDSCAELAGKRVLLIEPNPAWSDIISGVLNGWGARVNHSAAGDDCLGLVKLGAAQNDPVDICLISAEARGAAEAIRDVNAGDPGLRPLLAVMLPGPVKNRAKVSHLAEKADGIIQKPIKRSEMKRLFKYHLGRGNTAK